MTADSKRVRRGAAIAPAAVLILCGAAAFAGEPGPAPSPTPQAAASPTPAPSGAPTPRADKDAPAAAPEVRTVRSVFGTIMGTVFDSRKKPLSGWMVQLSSRGDDSQLRVTGTDDKGQYVFKDLPAGTYAVEIQTENEAARTKDMIEVRPPFRNIVDFQVGPQAPEKAGALAAALQAAGKDPGGTRPPGAAGSPDGASVAGEAALQVPVRGTFLDSQKRPVSEVSVTFVALAEKRTYQAFSGDDGVFTIPALPPGRYRVLVFSPGYVPIDLRSIEVSPPSGLNLSLALVDYPLNTKDRPEDRLPRERPLPAPAPPSTSGPS